jgi:hypothetical protein
MSNDVDRLFQELSASDQQPQTASPNKDLEDLVTDIFEQASKHRDWLIKFYIWYTATLSLLVMFLIFVQAGSRLFVEKNTDLELIPQWALDLIIVGMFGQFIGLLTIVTKKVWEFKPFLDHAKKTPKE